MAAPRIVQEQAAKAEELHQQLYGTPDTSSEAQDDAADAEQASDTPAIEPEGTAPEADAADTAAEDTGHAADENDLNEKHRRLEAAYATLQGKYRAEVPRLQEQVRTLQAQLIEAQQAKAQAEQSEQATQAELDTVQARLKEEIGDDAFDAVSEYTKQLVRSEMGDLKAKPAEKAEGPTDVERFWSTLRRREPTFDQINESPAFLQWLQTPDPSTGFPYQDSLNAAGQDLDVLSVLDLVKQFKHDTQPKPKPESSTAPAQQVAAPKAAPRTVPNQQPSYTPQDYADLQEQKRRGMWAGREQEFRALEQEIHAALIGG
ncbi:hypothetical protein [Marinobacter sp.]|uniref:hypothetical protein n=1 Tax=Marinobacter sp. TaxID=50741 RepID=UPI003A8D7FFF